MKQKKFLFAFILAVLCSLGSFAQISPGELTKAHASLEGVSNCTKCHTIGKKVSSQKCLDCHKEIKAEQVTHHGFHASAEVTSKECAFCHKEHHGAMASMTRFDQKKFDHSKTGFTLKGVHARKECRDCHKAEFITDPKYKKNPNTFMGLNSKCTTCHFDYHQGKMQANCATCHGFESFKKPHITGFDHNKTKYPLLGKHQTVSCAACHKTEMLNGKKIQRFTSIPFENCTPCHKDAHENKFGQDCKRCHSEESWHSIKSISTFDHDKTAFKLVGKHQQVDCKKCHKTQFMTDPVKHDRCSDCHTDYHKGEFAHNGVSPDCNECHTNNSFEETKFSIERHNKLKFKLEGAHMATPCMACHKKQDHWTFKQTPTRCVDCHANVHKGFIDDKFMANNDCSACHSVRNWTAVKFDHNRTKFPLDGAHARITCAACHYAKNAMGVKEQKFNTLSTDCQSCHKDNHHGQFEVNGKTDCSRCHGTDKWTASRFDHNTSRFKLEGKHANVKCEQCHKEITDSKGNKYVQYKFKSIACATCHS
jgi:hypothetical protein